jgi:hypothetical protein
MHARICTGIDAASRRQKPHTISSRDRCLEAKIGQPQHSQIKSEIAVAPQWLCVPVLTFKISLFGG